MQGIRVPAKSRNYTVQNSQCIYKYPEKSSKEMEHAAENGIWGE